MYEFISYCGNVRNVTTATRARKIVSIRQFWKYLKSKAHLLENNVAEELEAPKLPKRMPKYLSLEESIRLLIESEKSARDYCILTIFLNCALRLSELVSINLEQVEANTLQIIGKGNKERKIFLTPATKKAISAWLEVRKTMNPQTNALFITKHGTRVTSRSELLREMMNPEYLSQIYGLKASKGIGKTGLTEEEMMTLSHFLSNDVGSQAVRNGIEKLGMPYSQSYRDSGTYYDCSSFTYYCYKEAGISLLYHDSNTAAAQAQLCSEKKAIISYKDLEPGDLVFYSFQKNGRYLNISHVAMYCGGGMVIDASSSKGCVVYREIYSLNNIVLCGRPRQI